MKANQKKLPEHFAHRLLQGIALLTIGFLIFKSLEECEAACCEAAMSSKFDYLVILAVAYFAHILLRLHMHHRRGAKSYAWTLRILIVGLSLLPHMPHLPVSAAPVITADAVMPLVLLIAIEILMSVYMWIFDKRPPRRRRSVQSPLA
jgi:hypothetical protein